MRRDRSSIFNLFPRIVNWRRWRIKNKDVDKKRRRDGSAVLITVSFASDSFQITIIMSCLVKKRATTNWRQTFRFSRGRTIQVRNSRLQRRCLHGVTPCTRDFLMLYASSSPLEQQKSLFPDRPAGNDKGNIFISRWTEANSGDVMRKRYLDVRGNNTGFVYSPPRKFIACRDPAYLAVSTIVT